MKTFIVYYSFSGNNEFLAKLLQKKLNCDIEKVLEPKKRNGLTILLDVLFKRKPKLKKTETALTQYDHIILVAPVWNMRIASPMEAFIETERENLKEYSFITVCSGAEGQLEKITSELNRLALKMPKTVAELKVNDLLPPEQKGKIIYATPYRIGEKDLHVFNKKIESFLWATDGHSKAAN